MDLDSGIKRKRSSLQIAQPDKLWVEQLVIGTQHLYSDFNYIVLGMELMIMDQLDILVPLVG